VHFRPKLRGLQRAKIVLTEPAKLVLEIAVRVGRFQFRVVGQVYGFAVHDSLGYGYERVAPYKTSPVRPLITFIELVNNANERVQAFSISEDPNELVRALLLGALIKGPDKPGIKQIAASPIGHIGQTRK
jgi:hypothetical protein